MLGEKYCLAQYQFFEAHGSRFATGLPVSYSLHLKGWANLTSGPLGRSVDDVVHGGQCRAFSLLNFLGNIKP